MIMRQIKSSFFVTATDTDSNETAENECLKISPFNGSLFDAGILFFIKKVFYILGVLHGQVETTYVTPNYAQVRLPTTKIDRSYALQWIVNTLLGTVIVMNLLVALTIGRHTKYILSRRQISKHFFGTLGNDFVQKISIEMIKFLGDSQN